MTFTQILNGIKDKIIEENEERNNDVFKEVVILNLKKTIKEKDLEISRLKGKNIPILETPKFNKLVDDKMIDDTFISLVLYKSFKIIQFHAIKNSIEKVGITSDKTIKALLNLTPEKVFEKGIKPEEVESFVKYYPMIDNFIREKVEKDYDSLKSSNVLGSNIRKICELLNEILGKEHIKKSEMINIENFSNKIIK